MELEIFNPLQQFQVSSNELGDIYRIPSDVVLNIDMDLIMSVFIHCEIKHKSNYTEIIVIHKGALNKKLSVNNRIVKV